MIRLITTSLLVLLPSISLYAKNPAERPILSADRTVVVSGTILPNNQTVQAALSQLSSLVNSTANPDAESLNLTPVNIIIDSPGGSVLLGGLIVQFVDTLTARGIIVNCYVPLVAASMAFTLFMHCTNRYAGNHSYLLWHRARTTVKDNLTTLDAAAISASLALEDERVKEDIKRTLGDTDEIWTAYNNESLNTVQSVVKMSPKFLTILNDLGNVYELLQVKTIAPKAGSRNTVSGDGEK